jgi:pimeloyl-ACP methyl ester carboxylesterase
VPTLVIHGMLDPMVTPSGGVATARAVSGARLIRYPEMGHDVPADRWDEIIDEIVRHTRRALRPGGAITRRDEGAS